MRLTISKTDLIIALAHATSVVERRNTIPIIANVALSTVVGGLRIRATDLDIEVSEPVFAAVEREGRTTVNASLLHDVVRKLPPAGSLTLDLHDYRLTVSSGRSKFELPTLEYADFPTFADPRYDTSFEIPAADLRRIFEKARFAISSDETRYYLAGVYLHVATGDDGAPVLRGVATDGHRLARIDAPLPEGAQGMAGVIVPRKTVEQLRKLLDGADVVRLSVSQTKIRAEIGDLTVASKVIDGTFPDYSRVIPRGGSVMQADADELSRAVDRVSTVSSERSRGLEFALSEDRLILTCRTPDGGSAVEDLTVGYEGEQIKVGFNGRYVAEIMSQIDSGDARWAVGAGGAPSVIRDGGDPSALYVLMPMRV